MVVIHAGCWQLALTRHSVQSNHRSRAWDLDILVPQPLTTRPSQGLAAASQYFANPKGPKPESPRHGRSEVDSYTAVAGSGPERLPVNPLSLAQARDFELPRAAQPGEPGFFHQRTVTLLVLA